MQPSSPAPIFQTQPSISFPAYQRFMNQVRSYTQNLNHHLEKAFNDQNKTIKRKRQELEKQLQDLREKFYTERIRIIQIEDHFKRNCENVIKNDMKKWQEHQQFFADLLHHYQYEIQIQSLINTRNQQKVKLLREQLKQCLKNSIKQEVTQRLDTNESLSKSKIKSKRSMSVKSQSKLTQFKIKTEASEYTRPTQMNQNLSTHHKFKLKTQKLHTEQEELHRLPLVSQKLVRLKTDMSLPSLKKSTIVNFDERIQNDDFNFMKPIRTIKKSVQQESLIPEIIKMFQWQNHKIESKQVEPDWFEKVVFNKRNLQKIINHLENQFENTVSKKKFPQSANKVKDLVAKNLFRLKTQSSTSKNLSKIELREKSLLNVLQKSQQLIKG